MAGGNKNEWTENKDGKSRYKPYQDSNGNVKGVIQQGKFELEANRRNHGEDREYPHYNLPSEGKEHYSVSDKERYEVGKNGKPDFSKPLK